LPLDNEPSGSCIGVLFLDTLEQAKV